MEHFAHKAVAFFVGRLFVDACGGAGGERHAADEQGGEGETAETRQVFVHGYANSISLKLAQIVPKALTMWR
jgi:hypothetical protein